MKFLVLSLLFYIQLVSSQQALAAESIGRLFTSPAERSNLDHLRQSKKKLIAPTVVDAPVDTLEATPVVLPNAVN
jgi:hypothetical protein